MIDLCESCRRLSLVYRVVVEGEPFNVCVHCDLTEPDVECGIAS